MSSAPITSVFNDGIVADAYEAYRRNPDSVDESWRQFFRFAERIGGAAPAAGLPDTGAAAASAEQLRIAAGAATLMSAIRTHGHLAVAMDPLGTPPVGAAELTAEFHRISEDELPLVPAAALVPGVEEGTAADVIARLRAAYCGRIGHEFEHLQEEEERAWFRETVERGELTRPLAAEEKKAVLRRLSQVDGLERFLGRAYQGFKRFSIEGTDALVPMLDAAIELGGAAGAREVVMAMAHRGRLNVLAHVLGKPYGTVFEEFEGRHTQNSDPSDTGDVKYHLGARGTRTIAGGRTVEVTMLPNPSHLEFVNPVLEGVARARQRGPAAGARDEQRVLPICIHGDAAFPGEGVVAETLNLSRLRGFRTGGTIHLIVNNQVGFTTDPQDARSTYYASDLAKGFEVPILHVNADDADSCIAAVRIAVAYRVRFGKDVLIDLVGYRRHGHNETDEPGFTQPRLYYRIKAHPTPREVWGARLASEGVVTEDEVKAIEQEVAAELVRVHDAVKSGALHPPPHEKLGPDSAPPPPTVDTTVRAEHLVSLNERLLAWPPTLRVHARLAKTLERRRDAMGAAGGIDWGHAEALAFASLLVEGVSIRLTGQDVERGTFSHRQAVLRDIEGGPSYAPLANLPGARATFEIYNSPLSETAVMGFEYGFSTAAPDALVLWEAQFGDFGNVAQPVIDQFMAADRAKWGQDSGLVLLLPHGYEGQGPEHSSARLERFLQLAAEGNLVVAYPSTPGQYFHVLRRQAMRRERRPLVLMQPKSLLRLPEAASRLGELAAGGFRPVIDDPRPAARRPEVLRLIFCTGKVYYDLAAQAAGEPVAVVRVEELYPWPHEAVARVVDQYPSVEEVVWVQEEPKNMGAWTYVAPRLRASTGNSLVVRYVGRPERASPAEGYLAAHTEEQGRIVREALAPVQQVSPSRRTAAR
ncbi:MAG TPA: 2-oxoglutarate dehydrogenase E1 component [Gemmatimonadaceae bacterium]|nr:2-oxoglutarate dehydrogenase E1 component [Gemmatimonadaceae bacterium]